MNDWLRQYLSTAARRELDDRERLAPAKIAAGELSQEEADAAIAAWRTIAELFETGSAETGLSFAELELATSRALIARSQAADANPHSREHLVRRDSVAAIHDRIAWNRNLAAMHPSTRAQEAA